jgi:hypothetical protein
LVLIGNKKDASQMPHRIYTDESLGKHADEHLEIVFKEVYDWKISDHIAIGVLLDPYVKTIFGEAYVPFGDALENLQRAITWAMQFGELRIIPITAEDRRVLFKDPDLAGKVIDYGAKIGNDKQDQFRAYGATLNQVIVLAGVQVLREYSYELLNKNSNDQTH